MATYDLYDLTIFTGNSEYRLAGGRCIAARSREGDWEQSNPLLGKRLEALLGRGGFRRKWEALQIGDRLLFEGDYLTSPVAEVYSRRRLVERAA